MFCIAKAASVYRYTFLQQPRSWAGAVERVGVNVCSYSLLTVLFKRLCEDSVEWDVLKRSSNNDNNNNTCTR